MNAITGSIKPPQAWSWGKTGMQQPRRPELVDLPRPAEAAGGRRTQLHQVAAAELGAEDTDAVTGHEEWVPGGEGVVHEARQGQLVGGDEPAEPITTAS
ncbi:MAG: hypothetical protein ABI776_01585 [Nocardioidaceae bacterium]